MEKSSRTSPRDFIARSLSPLVAVAASEDAEELCRVNHIPSFNDFIKPFGDLIEGRVTARDWQGVPISLDNFNIRFKAINKLEEPNHQAVMKLVQENVKFQNQTLNETIQHIRNKNDITEAYLNMPLEELTPWFTDFKNTILSLRGITEYETFDHPVATMIVISSSNPDPLSTIMQLYNPNIPSFAIDKPYVDTNILRFYIVLHDPNKTTLEHSTELYEKLKRTVGLHCYLLKLNSKPRDPNDDESIEDLSQDEIRAIWEEGLADTYRVESDLQTLAANISAPSSAVGSLMNTSIPDSPTIPSPAVSNNSPGHSRTPSVSSSISQPLPNTVIHGTSIQSLPIDILDEENNPLTAESETITRTSTPTPGTIQYGRCLTMENIHDVKNMMREFTVQSLIPFMERNIQHWNEQVASARRGLTGRLFGASRRLFGTSNRTAAQQSVQSIPAHGPNVPYGITSITVYPYAAPEAQMRKLADYAFMLRDYKFAYTIYDTVRRDYATEKAYKYHAGTQEMMGVCLLMSNSPTNKVDIDRHFELAVQQYLSRCRSSYHATRATVIYYELLKSRRMWKEMPTALVRMTGEDSDLRSGLFLEQAAHCFLRGTKPMVRKYGFHLVMAGHRYGKANQRQHAYRCYELASYVLENNTWSIAKSHIQFALGRQAFHLGRLEDAVTYFSDVLTDTKQSSQQQLAHIREFLFIYKQYTTSVGIDPLKESLPHLALPTIDDRLIQVTLSNVQSNIAHREEWAGMELELLENSIAQGFIASSKRAMAVQQQDDHRVVCAVGEPAIVHIELSNPLQVAITISNIILGCSYSDPTPTNGKNEEVDAYQVMPDCTNQKPNSNLFSFENFDLEKISEITLEPLETKTISLTIIPSHEGSVQVNGLHYTLNELVHTFRSFHKKGKRLNRTKEEMMTVQHAPDRSLDILVTSPMPLLDLTFHNVPETILSGEVVQIVLEINNKGNKGLTALRLKSSHPSFICVGNPEEMDKDIYASNGDVKDTKFESKNQLFDSSVITIPLPAKKEEEHSHDHGVVEPGETTLVPLWIRGDRIGKHTFKFLFSYQSEQDNKMIAHRTLRYTIHVQVLPSLKINAFTRPSATAVNEYILGVEIENLQTVANFDLTQLTVSSPTWTITPLSIDMSSEEDVLTKTVIPPRQTTFAYYKIRKSDHSDTSCPEAWTSNALGRLLDKSDPKNELLPPPIQLNLTKLRFRQNDIPFDSIPLKTFALNSRMHWRQSHLEGQFPNISTDNYPKLFTLYNTGDIDLALYWDIPQMKRHGHHYIIGVNLGVQQNPFQGTFSDLIKQGTNRTMFEATAKERAILIQSLTRNRVIKDESPIKLMVNTPDRAAHDFEKEGLLKIPVAMTLKNCSWNKSGKYTLELLPWSENKAKQQQGAKMNIPNSLNIFPFHWTGSTVFTGTLNPEESVEIQVFAIFQLPGVYDINRWKLTVRTDEKDDSEIYVHYPTLPQLVTTVAL